MVQILFIFQLICFFFDLSITTLDALDAQLIINDNDDDKVKSISLLLLCKSIELKNGRENEMK